MKICVINGNPKGDNSISLQYAHCLAIKFNRNQFTFINAGQKIREFEKDPETFLSVASGKLFRDMLYNMKFVFKADHDYYSRHGLFSFPNNKYSARAVSSLVATLLKIPFLRGKFQSGMIRNMVEPYRKVLEKTRDDSGLSS